MFEKVIEEVEASAGIWASNRPEESAMSLETAGGLASKLDDGDVGNTGKRSSIDQSRASHECRRVLHTAIFDNRQGAIEGLALPAGLLMIVGDDSVPQGIGQPHGFESAMSLLCSVSESVFRTMNQGWRCLRWRVALT